MVYNFTMTTSQERRLLIAIIFVSLVVGFVAALLVTGQTPVQRHNSGDIVVEEDGSGVQYHGDTEVRTFPEDTFVWDCTTMGNRRCG